MYAITPEARDILVSHGISIIEGKTGYRSHTYLCSINCEHGQSFAFGVSGGENEHFNECFIRSAEMFTQKWLKTQLPNTGDSHPSHPGGLSNIAESVALKIRFACIAISELDKKNGGE